MRYGVLSFITFNSALSLVHVVTPLSTADKVRERVGQAEGAEVGGVVTAEEPFL